ncbi:MAG: hypothetical protein GYA48_15190 [Chloroflexi bacterium]|nr:hypothetical protein [Chloroflexota bacterium]
MAERSSIFQTVQIGVEVNHGVAVPANRKLQSVGLSTAMKTDIKKFRPAGSKFPTITALGKEWVEHSLSGQLTYTEILYLFASIFGLDAGQPTDNLDGSYTWLFSPNANQADNFVTFTIEQGGSVRSQRSTYGLVKDLTLNFSRDEATVEGGALAQALEDNVVMTGAPSAIDLVPVLPTHICIYLSDTFAGLDAADPLQRVLSCSYSMADRFGAIWPMNRNLNSFGAVVETEPKPQLKLKMEADAEGMALLNSMRSGSTKFLRIEAVGDEIAVGVPYELIIDTAVQVEEPGEFEDADGLYAIEWTFTAIQDSAWNKATQLSVTNSISTL